MSSKNFSFPKRSKNGQARQCSNIFYEESKLTTHVVRDACRMRMIDANDAAEK